MDGDGGSVAVYCGPGGAVAVPFRHGARVQSVYDGAVASLCPRLTRRLGYPATPADVVLWRVSGTDALDALQAGGGVGAGGASRLGLATTRLKPWATIAADTFAPGDAIWVELDIGAYARGVAARAADSEGRRADERRNARAHSMRHSCHPRARPLSSAPRLASAPPLVATGPQLSSSPPPLFPSAAHSGAVRSPAPLPALWQ